MEWEFVPRPRHYDSNYSYHQQHYDGDMEPPNDMMVDPAEYVEQEDLEEKDDVAIINPDQLGSDGDLPEKLRADDCTSILLCTLWLMR
jgi:hypothetical protein